MNFIDKINSIGSNIYDFVLGKIQAIPGVFQGLIVLLICFLCIMGILSFFKKSIKFFLFLIFLVVGIFIVLQFVK